MMIPVFDGETDAYWWVLCTEKYFKHWLTPETLKMTVAGLAMKGPALTWWLRWYPRHSCVNWDAFTSIFLWQFKPEWREILPVAEEDLELEPPQLVQGGYSDKQPKVVEERINDFNQHSSSIDVADLEIAASVKDSTVQSQIVSKTSFKNEYKPLFFEPENQDGDNKIQPYEFVIEGLDTVTAVADEQKGLITSVCKDKDLRFYFNFNFLVSDQFRSSCFTLARFTPTFSVPSMKATVNTTSATSPQHLVPLFDPGGYFIVQESWSTNQVLPPPPKPPDRSFYGVSAFIYNNDFAKEMLDYSAIWTLFSGFASIDYVQVLSQIPYVLQSDLRFNFYTFNIASSIYIHLHEWCLASQVHGLALAIYRNQWKSKVDRASQCLIYFCANFGSVYSVRKVFAEMPRQSVVSWLTFIQEVLINTYGWEVYASLSLNLCNTWACCDAHKYCISSTSSQAICDGTSLQLRPHQTGSLIKDPHECNCKIPWYCEDNHKISLLKKFVLTIQPIASTDDHLLMFPSHKHYNLSKCVRNVDLVHLLLLNKYAMVLVVTSEMSCEYYSIGYNDKTMPIILTWKYLPTLCSHCLRLRSYANDNIQLQYYQVHINGLEEPKAKFITIVGDYTEALVVQFIRVKYFVHKYLNSSNLDKDACWDIFIGFLESHCVVELLPWQGLIHSAISHEYWEYSNNFYNLEDKVGLQRVDSDVIHVVWISCVLAWMIHNEVIKNDIKAVEIMEKIKHKKIVRLQYCCIVLDGNLVAKVVAFGVTKINGCESMHIIVRPCGCTSEVKMGKRKKWDPGRQGDMCTTTWSTKFKQWDPGKFCVVSNFYNLEDKVDFEEVGNVMILEAQIMPSPKVKRSDDSSTF